MPASWPETIVFGHIGVRLKNGWKPGLHKPKSPRVFGHSSRQGKTALRVGLYARVSTLDQRTIALQIRALRDYAARRR